MPALLFFCLYALVVNSHGNEHDLDYGARSDRLLMLYTEKESGRLVYFVVNPLEGQMVDCYVSGDRAASNAIMEKVAGAAITHLSEEGMNQITSVCMNAKEHGHFSGEDGSEVYEQFGVMSFFFIYPGTKWCGPGNIAKNYEDLGTEIEADMCCRDHDHCPDNINGHKTKHGLKNDTPFTRSHCDCDDKFHRCLEKANTTTSNELGQIYFNFLEMKCFRQDYPVKECLKDIGSFTSRCQEYQYDTSAEKIWQFFDAKYYKETPDEKSVIQHGHKGDVFEFVLLRAGEGKHFFLPTKSKRQQTEL